MSRFLYEKKLNIYITDSCATDVFFAFAFTRPLIHEFRLEKISEFVVNKIIISEFNQKSK